MQDLEPDFVRPTQEAGSPSHKQEGEWATVRLLLPRSGYAPQQKSEPQEVGITAEANNDALGGLFPARWSVLHALAPTPPAPRSQVGRRHARYCLALCRHTRGGRSGSPASRRRAVSRLRPVVRSSAHVPNLSKFRGCVYYPPTHP